MDDIDAYVKGKYDWSVLESGWCQPVLVAKDGKTVIDGAHRVVAARALGKKIPVIRLDIEVEEMDPNALVTWIDKARELGMKATPLGTGLEMPKEAGPSAPREPLRKKKWLTKRRGG